VDEPDGLLRFEYPDLQNNVPSGKDNMPFEFEDFKNKIDTRGGYLMSADPVRSFMTNVDEDCSRTKEETDYVEPTDESINWKHFGLPETPKETVYVVSSTMLPDVSLELNDESREDYKEDRHTETAKAQDAQLGLIKEWLVDPHMQPSTLNHKQFENFARRAKEFYLDIDNKLFRWSPDGRLKAVIEKTHQMYIMWSLHDYLGHKGTFATKELINK